LEFLRKNNLKIHEKTKKFTKILPKRSDFFSSCSVMPQPQELRRPSQVHPQEPEEPLQGQEAGGEPLSISNLAIPRAPRHSA
jgi:hypothetical protein